MKLKTLDYFKTMNPPIRLGVHEPVPDVKNQMILRMLVKSKYEDALHIPKELLWLKPSIKRVLNYDTRVAAVKNKWCYVTIRHGIDPVHDNAWHLDGGSLRTELIPERNYIYVSNVGTEYLTGKVTFSDEFDPDKDNIFSAIKNGISAGKVKQATPGYWHLFTPNVFHRKSPKANGVFRTFVRITFPDIEIRDENNTQNPLLPTNAFGRDPAKTFRDNLLGHAHE